MNASTNSHLILSEPLPPDQNGAADAIKDWLAVRGGTKGPLFVEVNKGGQVFID